MCKCLYLTAECSPQEESAVDVRMGESDAVMEYDENFIFNHLYVEAFSFPRFLFLKSSRCFYLDTPDNARENDMGAKSKHEETIVKK